MEIAIKVILFMLFYGLLILGIGKGLEYISEEFNWVVYLFICFIFYAGREYYRELKNE